MRVYPFVPCLLMVAALGSANGSAADLDAIRADVNLERRAHSALDAALAAFTDAKTEYAAGEMEKTAQRLKDMEAAVDVAHDALVATGKDPRRHVRPFKLAETASRDLLRRVEGLENAMDADDRKLITGPRKRLQEVHDQWLEEIISGRH